ncbi:hypothetical protein H1R20_g9145, partial [Candolleomyces eurysporus]
MKAVALGWLGVKPGGRFLPLLSPYAPRSVNVFISIGSTIWFAETQFLANLRSLLCQLTSVDAARGPDGSTGSVRGGSFLDATPGPEYLDKGAELGKILSFFNESFRNRPNGIGYASWGSS